MSETVIISTNVRKYYNKFSAIFRRKLPENSKLMTLFLEKASDVSKEADKVVDDFRKMTPAEKLERVKAGLKVYKKLLREFLFFAFLHIRRYLDTHCN